MVVLRVIVYALAFVCRNVAFHIAVVGIAGLCCFCVFFCCVVVACMRVLRVIAYAFAFFCCKLAFHITRVCKVHARLAFVLWVRLFVLARFFPRDCAWVCHCMWRGCVSYSTRVKIACVFFIIDSGLFV